MKSYFLDLCSMTIPYSGMTSPNLQKLAHLVTDGQRPLCFFQSKDWTLSLLPIDATHVLYTTPDLQSGASQIWLLFYDRLIQPQKIGCKNKKSLIYCRQSNFYKISYRTEKPLWFGRDMWGVNYKNNKKMSEFYSDGTIQIDADGELYSVPQTNGLMTFVTRNDFVSCDRVAPHVYQTFKLIAQPLTQTHPALSRVLKFRQNLDHIQEPRGFDAFLKDYRAKQKEKYDWNLPLTVRTIFFDANQDGKLDFYMTCDCEKENATQWKWTLFINTGESFTAATQILRRPTHDILDVVELEPKLTARPTDFYYFMRLNQAPFVLVTRQEGELLFSQTYLKYSQNKKMLPPGMGAPLSFKEHIENPLVGSIKRLKCEIYEEFF